MSIKVGDVVREVRTNSGNWVVRKVYDTPKPNRPFALVSMADNTSCQAYVNLDRLRLVC